jgi:xylulokinase
VARPRAARSTRSARSARSARTSSEPLYVGIDVGTSGIKVLLVNASGDIEHSGAAPLALATPQPGWAEQNPDAWWRATLIALGHALRGNARLAARVASIGISGQMHSSVFLDRSGKVIRPALLWCDARTAAECREITERAGGELALRDWVRNAAFEGFTLPKVLWLRNHEPQAFRRLAKLLLAKDYVRYRLTGEMATEPSDASGTLMFDPARLEWSEPLLRAVDLPASLLPSVGESAGVLGRVTHDVAKVTGLPAGTPVVGGGADNACGAAGVGVIAPGDAVASWGTSGTVLAPTSEPLVDAGLRAHTFCHVLPRTWYVIGVVLSAGGAFTWFMDNIARELKHDDRIKQLNREAERVARGADGVIFLPYLQGDRTPHRDASARAAFLGLSLAHTRAHMTRAVLEGVCFALRDSLVILQELGLRPASLLLTGGGARSPFMRRLQAEILGIPVCTVNREEGAAYGAALLGAVGVGAFADLGAATRATLVRGALEQPDASALAEYLRHYNRYRDAFSAAHA